MSILNPKGINWGAIDWKKMNDRNLAFILVGYLYTDDGELGAAIETIKRQGKAIETITKKLDRIREDYYEC